MTRTLFFLAAAMILGAASCGSDADVGTIEPRPQATAPPPAPTANPEKEAPKAATESTTMSDDNNFEVSKSEDQWASELTPEQYLVLRQQGTERAFTGKFYKHKDEGTYVCAGCGQELFNSDEKYESGSGWPSFWAPKDSNMVEETVDHSHGMVRREVHCSRCGGHLGHVFEDGPQPTGLRYCINSASLGFEEND